MEKHEQCDEKKVIEPRVHRRILRFLNKARSVAELTANPAMKIEPELAKAILNKRPVVGAFGFTDIRQLFEISRFEEIFGGLIKFFDSGTHGLWTEMPIDLKLPDGITNYSAQHAALLHDGKVIFITRTGAFSTLIWDPDAAAGPTILPDNQPDDNLFCSGHSFLSDGQLLVIGGNTIGNEPEKGWKFDPMAGTDGVWTATAGGPTAGSVKVGRWYPTVLTLGGGRVLIVAGKSGNNQMEIYRESSDDFEVVVDPPGMPGASERAFPQRYPGLHIAPGGEIVYTRTGNSGNDTDLTAAFFRFLGPYSGEWVSIDEPHATNRIKGMSVPMHTPGGPFGWQMSCLVVGGSGADAMQSSETLHTPLLTPVWDHYLDLGAPNRISVNAVLLPDGNVFVCGGAPSGSASLMYDRSTDAWSEMDELNAINNYHSVVLLLPSGEVMAHDEQSPTIEIYKPPYLFNGPRPQITAAPDIVHHGGTMDITSPQAADIASVVLVRPMAVTHQTDSEQRVLPLNFTTSGTTLTVTAPNGNHPHAVAPKGYYMLFIVNNLGVPSVAWQNAATKEFILLH